MRDVLAKLAVGLTTVGLIIASTATPTLGTDPIAAAGSPPPGQTYVPPDAAWLASKQAHLVLRGADDVVSVQAPGAAPLAAPSSWTLGLTYSPYVVEPEGSANDDTGKAYTDGNFWLLCGAGGGTVALGYWGNPLSRMQSWPTSPVTDPYLNVTTTWKASANDWKYGYKTNFRGFLMYMAFTVFTTGMQQHGVFNGSSTLLDQLRMAINWEASDHNTNPYAYFYAVQWANGTRWSQAQLHADVVYDIYTNRVPTVVDVNTSYLPAWTHGGVGHTVTVVGYNDAAGGTYTYIDTCGTRCAWNSPYIYNGGHEYTITQAQLFNAIKYLPGGYLY
jgi:hypothetical protein